MNQGLLIAIDDVLEIASTETGKGEFMKLVD